mgnify:FL=1
MSSFLFLGFLIGMKHALEADHLAAVASMVSGNRSVRETIKLGTIWGIGHASALFVFGALAIMTDAFRIYDWSMWLEFGVGIMLIVLGADVLRRLYNDRIHFHLHRHNGRDVHIHAHSHKGEQTHDPDRHKHGHKKPAKARMLAMGLMHGMAGSAALILLTAGTQTSPWTGLLYIMLFGVGSVLGMALLSVIVAFPIAYSSHYLTWGNWALQGTIGVGTMILGGFIAAGPWI